MKEKLYTIPVNDAFNSPCECPICSMWQSLENDAVEYTMGPSYMEDDIRANTDKLGFCQKHIKKIYDCNNRLGFALVMKTHLDHVIHDIEPLTQQPVSGKTLFKKASASPIPDYIDTMNSSCFVCQRIENTFDRYLDTVFYMFKNDTSFRDTYKNSKGFCTTHYGDLVKRAPQKLSGALLDEFLQTTNTLYLDNMKRVRDDVEWFINKFDHKYADEPWKNSKDALPRSIIKDASLFIE